MASRRFAAPEAARATEPTQEQEEPMAESPSELEYLRNRVRDLTSENTKYRQLYKRHRDTASELQQRLQEQEQQYQARVSELESDLTELTGAFEEVFDDEGNSRPEYQGELDENIQAAVEEIQAENEQLRAALEADPDQLRSQLVEAYTELRNRDLESLWGKAISPGDLHEKVNLQTLQQLIGWDPDAQEEWTEDEIRELVAQAREAVPYAFAAPTQQAAGEQAPAGPSGTQATATQGSQATQQQARHFTQGLSSGRGGPVTGGSRFRATSAQMADPEFTRQNQATIAEHVRSNTFDLVD